MDNKKISCDNLRLMGAALMPEFRLFNEEEWIFELYSPNPFVAKLSVRCFLNTAKG